VLSPYSAKVRWALEWKRLEFDAVEVNPLGRAEAKSASGQGGVPVLRDGDTVVFDSTRIIAYLDSAYPDRRLIPEEPGQRARVLALEDWADEVFVKDAIALKIHTADNSRRMVERTLKHHAPAFWHPVARTFGPGLIRRATRSRLRGRTLEQVRADYEGHLDLLDRMLGGVPGGGPASAPGGTPFLAGESPTSFDAAVWGGLWSMKGMAGEELLLPRTALSAWFRRMRSEI
jgi:glutathione S-transferase